MQVGVLAGVAVAVFGDRKPAAVQHLRKDHAQGRDAVIDQLGEPRQP
jgi:hypothetical protein